MRAPLQERAVVVNPTLLDPRSSPAALDLAQRDRGAPMATRRAAHPLLISDLASDGATFTGYSERSRLRSGGTRSWQANNWMPSCSIHSDLPHRSNPSSSAGRTTNSSSAAAMSSREPAGLYWHERSESSSQDGLVPRRLCHQPRRDPRMDVRMVRRGLG